LAKDKKQLANSNWRSIIFFENNKPNCASVAINFCEAKKINYKNIKPNDLPPHRQIILNKIKS
jgi:hypothetical protein